MRVSRHTTSELTGRSSESGGVVDEQRMVRVCRLVRAGPLQLLSHRNRPGA